MVMQSLDLPPAVARGFVKAMSDYFAEADPHKRDAIAAHQLGILGEYQDQRNWKLRLRELAARYITLKYGWIPPLLLILVWLIYDYADPRAGDSPFGRAGVFGLYQRQPALKATVAARRCDQVHHVAIAQRRLMRPFPASALHL